MCDVDHRQIFSIDIRLMMEYVLEKIDNPLMINLTSKKTNILYELIRKIKYQFDGNYSIRQQVYKIDLVLLKNNDEHQ
jgi:hypothetical protein